MISGTSNLRNFDNGEKKNDIGFFMSIMGSLMAMEHTHTPMQVLLFKDTLEELIENELLSSHEVYLTVNYHPQGLLNMAAEKAGIDASLFPVYSTAILSALIFYTSFEYRCCRSCHVYMVVLLRPFNIEFSSQ